MEKLNFKRVIMVPGQSEIAKVNRRTGVLYLNPKVWEGLPTDQKEFVLFHEAGHLKLQTSSEFAANKYAIKNFLPVKTITKRELGQKIMVMREILDKADGKIDGFGLVDSIASAVSGITQTLPLLGIGSKARQAEAEINTANQLQLFEAQSEIAVKQSNQTTKTLVLGGSLLLVLVVIILTLKK